MVNVVFFYGTMGAGKTERLIKEINKNKGGKSIVIKSAIDNRAGEKYISTHNYLKDPVNYEHEKIEADYSTKSLLDLIEDTSFQQDVMHNQHSIYIDEGQFFGDLCEFITCMSSTSSIFISTLDRDWEKKYFPCVEKSFQIEGVKKVQLYATCDICKKRTAEYAYKKDSSLIINGFLVGGMDVYGSICDNCDKR
jgi:thymidine kinase